MPPRIPRFPCLRSSQAHQTPPTSFVLPFRSFTSTAPSHASTAQQKRRSRDPYILAQAAAKRAANQSRQEVLRKQRAAAYGDPVKGVTTPFLETFDTAGQELEGKEDKLETLKGSHLKHFLSASEIEQRLDESYVLSAPVPEKVLKAVPDLSANKPTAGTDSAEGELIKEHKARHDNATAAIVRIASLTNASSADRRRVNIQRSIDTFGRHNTDQTLPQRPVSLPAICRHHPDPAAWVAEETKKAEERRAANEKLRAGPDTGSSEVQIAILTAKIRTLSQFLESRGKGDKSNKRNLRLLVHRRQKLLKYLWRKEKGGPRWQHCVDSLGITDGAWKGEITL
ncbi:hypothetical protein NA57DRAFT_47950 [Rhizodiscina lignyota]|uniref:Ribosomal protein S15 n=1 Tax=Rhizodiscina lignyota TaxID=1504668 RepID=A0A9P4I586_9PEZI|nr:hypothetical protein NA57DRAFT_47950 [Rhizodiscina lignyota]